MSGDDGRPSSDASSDAEVAPDGDDASPGLGRPRASNSDSDERSVVDHLRRLRTSRNGWVMFARELVSSVAAVAAVGLLLFAVSGVWPPMVAVESGSMEPHMHKGDLVFITEPGRFAPGGAYEDTGVVTARAGRDSGYRTFGEYGSVIVYDDPGQGGSPVIHRAMFRVEAGENWYDKADSQFVRADNCRELNNCPAPHAGFVTKGDHNGQYDQAIGIADPVKPPWVTGIARVRVPYLGWIRLTLSTMTPVADTSGTPLAGTGGAPIDSASFSRASTAETTSIADAPQSASQSAWTGESSIARSPGDQSREIQSPSAPDRSRRSTHGENSDSGRVIDAGVSVAPSRQIREPVT